LSLRPVREKRAHTQSFPPFSAKLEILYIIRKRSPLYLSTHEHADRFLAAPDDGVPAILACPSRVATQCLFVRAFVVTFQITSHGALPLGFSPRARLFSPPPCFFFSQRRSPFHASAPSFFSWLPCLLLMAPHHANRAPIPNYAHDSTPHADPLCRLCPGGPPRQLQVFSSFALLSDAAVPPLLRLSPVVFKAPTIRRSAN